MPGSAGSWPQPEGRDKERNFFSAAGILWDVPGAAWAFGRGGLCVAINTPVWKVVKGGGRNPAVRFFGSQDLSGNFPFMAAVDHKNCTLGGPEIPDSQGDSPFQDGCCLKIFLPHMLGGVVQLMDMGRWPFMPDPRTR